MPQRSTSRAAVIDRGGTATGKQPEHGVMYRRALLAGAVALYVPRPLVPSESVAWQGDGLPWVLGWLALALAVAWGAASNRLGPRRWLVAEWAAVFLAGWQALAAMRVVWTGDGAPRPALNMLWEQLALVVGFLVVRQLVFAPAERRAIVAVMLALATSLAAHGWYQYLVTLPATRAEYARDPDRALMEAGQWSPPGSAERARFEQRLASTEPMASFALANSLSGVLAAWCIVGAGVAAGVAGPRWRQGILLLAWLAVATCLLLTKSRSAVAGAACGGVLLAMGMLRPGQADRRKLAAAGLVAIVLSAVLFATGGLDREVLSEAPKSLGYRWEYWRASARMLADQPWLGCGPGNFGDRYTAYKLPQSSEEIADPHNAVIELATTAGWPAAAGLLLVWLATGIAVLRLPRVDSPLESNHARDAATAGATRWIPGGAAGGVLLAMGLGTSVGFAPSLEVIVGQGLIAVAVLAALAPWVAAGELTARHLMAGAAALAVNLLAAGGIGYPGVAGSLWLLLALSLASMGEASPPKRSTGRWATAAATVATLLLVVSCWATAYGPVFAARAHIERAQHAAQAAGDELRTAAAADRWDSEPWRRLARWEFERWRQTGTAQPPSDADWKLLESAETAALRLRPHSSSLWLECADRRFLLAQATGDPARLRESLARYRQAVARYPTSALRRGQLAEALAASGETEAARAEAAEALGLSERTPHLDQKLSAEQRQRLLRITPDATP